MGARASPGMALHALDHGDAPSRSCSCPRALSSFRLFAIAQVVETRAHHNKRTFDDECRTNGKEGICLGWPWPMSEGIQEKKHRVQHSLSSSEAENTEDDPEVALQPQSSELSSSSAPPRAGLVEAYGKLAGKRCQFSPDKVLFEYTRSLVSQNRRRRETRPLTIWLFLHRLLSSPIR
jgi:hypothetical protein